MLFVVPRERVELLLSNFSSNQRAKPCVSLYWHLVAMRMKIIMIMIMIMG